MGVYRDSKSGRLFVQFRSNCKVYKKRLPVNTAVEDAKRFESEWKDRVRSERIAKQLDIEVAGFTLNNRTRNKGAIYVVRGGDLYKIGMTRNAGTRLRGLQNSGSTPLQILVVFSVANPELVESQLHRMFKSKREHGEWFRLSDDDVEFIRCLVVLRVRFNGFSSGKRADQRTSPQETVRDVLSYQPLTA